MTQISKDKLSNIDSTKLGTDTLVDANISIAPPSALYSSTVSIDSTKIENGAFTQNTQQVSETTSDNDLSTNTTELSDVYSKTTSSQTSTVSVDTTFVIPETGDQDLKTITTSETNELAIDGSAVSSTASSTASSTLSADSNKNTSFSSPIDYQATDSIKINLESEKMQMFNESQVKTQEQQINAYYIEVDIQKNLVHANYGLDTADNEIGYPVFKDRQSEYEVQKMSYNIKSKKAVVKDILTKEGEGYIRSDVSKRIAEDTFFLKDGRYTTCDNHDHPHYYIKLKKAKMIKDDKVITGPANLVIEGVPTPLGLPFGLFPLKKRYSSGIIIPSFGEEKTRGFYFRDFGYYWAINDYYDLRLNGSIYTNGSWEVNTNTTYKKRYRYNGRFNFSYAMNQFGDKGLDDYRKTKDFSLRWTHSQDSKAHPYRTLSASVNISTSENDYRNARSIENIVNSTKQSSVSYSRRWPDSPFNLSVALQHSQNRRDTTISLTLPNVSFSMQTQYPFRSKERVGELKWYDMISVSYNARLTNTIRTHEDKLFKSDLKRDWRNGFKHDIPIGASYKLAKDLTFSANVRYSAVAYINSIRKSYDPMLDKVVNDTIDGLQYAHNFTTNTSVSYTPKYFGMYNFKKDSKVQAIRHVLSPSLSFSYTPDLGIENDRLFRSFDNNVSDELIRYNILSQGVYGVPQKAMQSGYINFSLDNNIEMKVRNTDDTTSNEDLKKIKLLESFRLSTSYDVFRDSMNFSNISLSGRTSLFNNKVNVQMSGSIDPYAIDEAGVRINKFAGGLGRLTSAGFSVGTAFNGDTFKSKGTDNNTPPNDVDAVNDGVIGGDEVFGDLNDVETFNDINEYVDFDIPWSVRLDYNFQYTKPRDKANTSQYLRLSGDVSITPKWKVSVSTGYDFSQSEVTTTSFSVFRDLHCWEMRFSAIPFGQRQSFSFHIGVKSTLLKDLKLQKRDSWYDNF
ncbi:hypothetical protein C7377_0564 [Balneicella halophila]|uniref:LPS-assembly protein LptD central domain-containing protein n=1 Tax=Balneicella halophila TaxID=1537566 RepID=A0A7L4USP5_BALHA|nr:putative LPS assembly protein LptD [Balneicella halophila]PVX52257.1 hypothetical protein C7377_0564 [Balneicella halophila]